MTPHASVLSRALVRGAALLPKGSQLSRRVWGRRHRAISVVGLVQAVAVAAFGAWRGLGVLHSLLEGAVVAALALAALLTRGPHPVRSSYATLSLMTASAMFVHQADGLTEWHFHFFVMVGLITLYQEWAPFLVAIAFVVLHHGVLGGLDPSAVFGSASAGRAPWKWALVHGAFVLAAAAVHVAAWRLSEEQGATDPLTGLPNRTGFTDLVDQVVAQGEHVAVLFVDLDGFKVVNDGLGHDAGDEVLRVVGRRLRQVLRAGDHAARLGGDEFTLLVPGLTAADAQRVAHRVLYAVNDVIHLSSSHREVHVRASVGIALSEPGVDGVELLRRADIAMYSAKTRGGSRTALFDTGLDALQLERGRFADDLRHAIDRDELHLQFQPVMDLPSGRMEGVEALLRWRHPERGEVPPATFVPIAEESGQIVAIGEWVLDAAVQQLAEWTAAGHRLTMAVNVSARQLDDPAFGERVLARLHRAQLPPELLVLELTESVLVDLEQVAERLGLVRAAGVRIAIDDFGTGYSSMSYLSRLPVDVVKIDQSFVRGLGEDAMESALVRSIVDLARNLQLGVVAEGVEDPRQAELLRALDCPTAQGYLWSRPVAPSDILELLERSAELAAR